MKAITPDMTTKFDKQFQANNKQQALQRAVVKNGITASAENISAHVANTPVFSIDLATGKVANQMQSGRCWMFAALNTFRHKMLNQFHLKEFELSQNYTFSGINMKRQITSMKTLLQLEKRLLIAEKWLSC